MTQHDLFESEFAAAMRAYVEGAPTSIDPVAYVRALRAESVGRRAGLLHEGLSRIRWLVLAALLGVALFAAFAVGFGNRPAILPVPSPSATASPTVTAAPTASPSPSATPFARDDALAFIRDGDLWMLTEGDGELVLVASDVTMSLDGDSIFASSYRWLHWSSDGTILAITAPSEPGADSFECVALFDAGSNALSELPECPLLGTLAGWTGDDESLLVRERAGRGLLAVDPITGESTELSDRHVCLPVVSPDGEWAAAIIGTTVQVASTSDYAWSEVGHFFGYGCGPFTGWDAPTWSPDSERVAFVSGGAAISIINRDGTDNFVLTTQATSWALPKWSPDGNWISYRAGDGLHIIRPDGTGDRLVYAGTVDRGRVSWAADGSRIYFGVPLGDEFYEATTLWVYDMSTHAGSQVQTGGLITDFAPRP